MYSWEEINQVDPEIAQCIKDEVDRQNSHIELIASENWVSKAVMAAMGSPLTNKYAEGYPGKRYYGGCECVDEVERLAIERAKELFQCEYVNVQPHSGAQANMAVFFAMLKPGDTVMGMNLAHGGHLSHGSPANFSGAYFNIVPYGVNDQGVIDYEEVRRIALEAKPKLIVAGASAYCRIIDFKKFREIADEAGAYLMVDIAHIAGLVAAGVHPSPIPYAHVTTTTTHKTLRGPRGGMIMSSAEIAKKFNFNKAVFPGIQGGPLMHVIAAKAGLVTKVRALDGEKKVLPGTSVQQGQLLIAGVVDTGGTEKPSVTTRFLAGKGEVWARTWYDLTVRVPLTYEKKVYTGKEKRSHTLIWGENRLKIGAKGSSICNVDCDKIKNQTQWTFFGLFALPVTWETETLLPYELEVTPRSRADAEAQGKDMLETYLAALLGETGSVTQRRFSTAVEGDTLVVTLSAECEEQIGKEVPIAVSEG